MAMDEVEERFATRLRAVRRALNWSAQEVANRSGISRAAISKMENEGRGISLGDAVALSAAVGVPLADMVRPGSFSVKATLTFGVDDGEAAADDFLGGGWSRA